MAIPPPTVGNPDPLVNVDPFEISIVDQDKEITRAKWFLGALGLSIISGYFALDELKYAVWGKTVPGDVAQAKPFREAGRRGRSTEMLEVEYSFPNEAGGTLTERDQVPLDWPLSGNKIMVEHIPGTPDSSRLAGNRNMVSVYLFLGSLAAIAGVVFVFYREAKASERKPVRQSR